MSAPVARRSHGQTQRVPRSMLPARSVCQEAMGFFSLASFTVVPASVLVLERYPEGQARRGPGHSGIVGSACSHLWMRRFPTSQGWEQSSPGASFMMARHSLLLTRPRHYFHRRNGKTVVNPNKALYLPLSSQHVSLHRFPSASLCSDNQGFLVTGKGVASLITGSVERWIVNPVEIANL